MPASSRRSSALFGAQRASDLPERSGSPFRSQPGERPDHLSRPSAAQHELPRWRAAQSNFLATECQCSTRSGCQIFRSERHLRRQTERIGRRGTAAGDSLATLCRERLDRLVGRRCPPGRFSPPRAQSQHRESVHHSSMSRMNPGIHASSASAYTTLAPTSSAISAPGCVIPSSICGSSHATSQ